MAKVSPAHSEDESEEIALVKDNPMATKSEEPMDVDDDEGNGDDDEEEYEIEAILDAKRGSFPNVGPYYSKHSNQTLTTRRTFSL
jgi:hypothetical protein